MIDESQTETGVHDAPHAPLASGSADALPPQLQGRLLSLATQLERMQDQIEALSNHVQQSGSQIDALTHHLTDLDAARPVAEQLSELLTRSESYREQLEEIASTAKKLTRTQFKANTLSESKEEQISAALETLRTIATHRENVQEERFLAQQKAVAESRAQARSELLAEMLPVLDGLELALDRGERLLARRQEQLQEQETARQRALHSGSAETPALQRVWQQVRRSLARPEPGFAETQPKDDSVDAEHVWQEGVGSWLAGLRLVRERFLSLLAAEDIEQIDALGQPFDPKLHVAVSAEERVDVAPGTVIEVVRPGYRRKRSVLRFAEVVVAKEAVARETGDQ